MKIYSTLQIGTYHTLHCEDDLLATPIGDGKLLCAVMDGCTMGTDSHLPSTLTAKTLRKIARAQYYKAFTEQSNPEAGLLLEETMRQLFDHWRHLKNYLQLERNETLNTLLLAIIDEKAACVEGICIGDGLVCLDGRVTEFDQDNTPDYLGYHLYNDFDLWYSHHKQRFSKSGIRSCSLATDGIFTFSRYDALQYPGSGNVFNFLLEDTYGKSHEGMLDRKVTEIAMEWGLKPTDDLAVVRVDL